jgi:hypothetical protein
MNNIRYFMFFKGIMLPIQIKYQKPKLNKDFPSALQGNTAFFLIYKGDKQTWVAVRQEGLQWHRVDTAFYDSWRSLLNQGQKDTMG